MELISVIIPVYNVEKYLNECIDSVLSSTYQNLEIILVDDGSPDNCPSICDMYSQKDSRIKVIHQSNAGVCAARNAGLNIATGEFIAFVDSDDIVSPILYEKMIETIHSTNADWVACEFTRDKESLLTNSKRDFSVRHLTDLEQQLSALVSTPSVRSITWTSGYVWNKLYRYNLITQHFPLNCLNIEDLQFNWDYAQNCKSLAIVPLPLYFYRLNETSITEKYRTTKADRILERGRSMSEVLKKIADQTPTEFVALKSYMIARAVYVMHGALFRVYANQLTQQDPDFVVNATQYIRKHWKAAWKQKETYNLRARLPLAVFVLAFPMWKIATKLLKF